jgi:transposase-like protein
MRSDLAGRIEVDETYLGGPTEGSYGREAGGKTLVVIAAQEDGKGTGRVRLRRIPDASAASLQGFIVESIEPGSTVRTDGWAGYEGLKSKGYKHEVSILQRRREGAAIRLLPRVHRVASLLKRWILGTHHGAVGEQQLAYYLDEFTFRFNRRTSASRGKLFYRLLQQAVQVQPRPFRSLVKPNG